MSNQIKAIVKAHSKEIKLSKHLNADALLSTMKIGFDKITDHRHGTIHHSLGDILILVCHVFTQGSIVAGL